MATNLVDKEEWLKSRADRLFEAGDPNALDYYQQLISSNDSSTRIHARIRLAQLAHSRADTSAAYAHLLEASQEDASSPTIAHALAQTALLSGRRGDALAHALEAIYLAPTQQRTDFLPGLAMILAASRADELGVRVLEGGLIHDPEHIQLLETLGHLYEKRGDWIEAIAIRDRLIAVLKRQVHLRDSLLLLEAPTVSATEEKQRKANRELQGGLQIAAPLEIDWDYAMETRNHSRGLHTLVSRIRESSDPASLLETTQWIWARAVHEKMDVHLGPFLLAACTEWMVRKLHWRPVPSDLAEAYELQEEQLHAANRLVASSLQITLLPVAELGLNVSAAVHSRIQNLLNALLFEVSLEDLQPRRLL